MTILLYARRKAWPVESVTVESSHRRVYRPEAQAAAEEIRSRVLLEGDLTEEQRERIELIAGRCPVHRTLESTPTIVNEVVLVE